jgi:hypothetical protein
LARGGPPGGSSLTDHSARYCSVCYMSPPPHPSCSTFSIFTGRGAQTNRVAEPPRADRNYYQTPLSTIRCHHTGILTRRHRYSFTFTKSFSMRVFMVRVCHLFLHEYSNDCLYYFHLFMSAEYYPLMLILFPVIDRLYKHYRSLHSDWLRALRPRGRSSNLGSAKIFFLFTILSRPALGPIQPRI